MRLKFIIDKKYELMIAGKNKDTRDYIKEFHRVSGKYLKNSCRLYQKSWNEINDELSDYIEKLTGYRWFYDKYFCVVSGCYRGLTNWGNAPKIARIWSENPDHMKMVTAHELIMSHYFEIIKRKYKNEKLTDYQIWALAELAALEIREDKYLVKRFWPFFWKDDIKYFGHKNIVFLWDDLHKAFVKRKNFDDYIQFGIELIKKYPTIDPQVPHKFLLKNN